MPRLRMDPASPRIAFALIAALLTLLVLSALIPQRGMEARLIGSDGLPDDGYWVVDVLGLDRIHFSPLLFVLLGLLGANLVLGNVRRFRTVLRVEKTLLKARHLGSITFHLALLTIIVAVNLNYLFAFRGVLGLTEGQMAHDTPVEYHRTFAGPLHQGHEARFTIRLEEVIHTRSDGSATTDAAVIMIRFEGSNWVRDTIRVNHPRREKDLEFHFGSRTGYSPELLVVDDEGRARFRKFVRLATREVDDELAYSDFVVLPEEAMTVGLEIHPPRAPEPEAGSGAATIPKRVVLVEQEGQVVHSGAIAADEIVHLDGVQLCVPRLRRWCYVEVVENPFLGFVFAGFWTGLAGLTINLVSRVLPRGKRRP